MNDLFKILTCRDDTLEYVVVSNTMTPDQILRRAGYPQDYCRQCGRDRTRVAPATDIPDTEIYEVKRL